MADQDQTEKLGTEGPARVLSEVKGRLERMEAGDMPVIQRVAADGTVQQVDPTGEMVRPDAARSHAMHDAAEAFAAEHGSSAAAQAAIPAPHETEPAPLKAEPAGSGPGLWARIKAWFRRS